MADDKDKQQYSYRPDIGYQDTYESDFRHQGYQSVQRTEEEDIAIGNDITNSITDTFNQVTSVIPLLPAQLQTVINGVYKPVLDSWATMNKNPYPQTIPDPDGVEYEPYNPGGIDPYPNKFIYPIPPDLPEPTPPVIYIFLVAISLKIALQAVFNSSSLSILARSAIAQ